jgi:hypothetical protein
MQSGDNGSAPASPEELALWTILDLRWPLLGDYVSRHPDAIDDIVAGKDPPQDGPEWLPALWDDEEVKDVITGNARHVNASLSTAAVTKLIGRAQADALTPQGDSATLARGITGGRGNLSS